MLFKTLNGRERDVSVSRYAIDWDAKKEVSGPQGRVKKFLRQFWEHKLVLEEWRIPCSLLRIDLVCITDMVAVEVSPEATHTMFNPFMHGSLAGYRDVLKRDILKEQWCELNRFRLVTLIDEDIANLSAKLFLDRFGVSL
jgi:hypothetical protein